MKYTETGFRALYKKISVFDITDTIRESIEGFPGADLADCVLTYGYIDREAGLTLEVLAAGLKVNERFRFAEGNDHISSKIRIENVKDVEFSLLEDSEGQLEKRYASKIAILSNYDADEEVEKSREIRSLDGFRDSSCIDDVLVRLLKDGLHPEECWARIIGLEKPCIVGTLLNEPAQDFGYHVGETIAFFVQETEDHKLICCSDMNPSMKLTAEDLADGSMLKEAIHVFLSERTNPHFIDILELLRDSYVWIPCSVIMGEIDQETLQQTLEAAEAEGDLMSLVGQTFTSQEDIRMVPDVLTNGDQYFFPVFTNAEEMGEYGERFSKVQEHFLKAISMARNNDKDVVGIVINPFSEPFVFEKQIFDLVEKMKSRLG